MAGLFFALKRSKSLGPDWQDCVSLEGFAFKPIIEPTGTSRFAPPGDSLFFVCAKKSKQKKAPPGIRVSLRSTPLLPVPLRGPAYKGHPWPFKPLAASMRLTPLRNDSAHPPEGAFGAA